MTLKELQDVLIQTELPITVHTNRLRWGECETLEDTESSMLQLATFVVIKADLHDHVSTVKAMLEICDAVVKGRYLEDCQRCLWDDHPCEYACSSEDTAHCEMFDDRPPHRAVLDWLNALHPLRPPVKDWIAAQLEVQRGLRAGVDRFLGGVQLMTPGLDDDGHEAMVEMSLEEFQARRAPHDAAEDQAHESVANRIGQYELNLERIRVICQQQGDLQEVAHLLTHGMPPQLRQPMNPS